MLEKTNVKTLDKVVVRFSGDSGDGMQLAGNIFTNVSAGLGNSVSTFPDYPADMRPPQGSLSGVSAFQASVGKGVHTPGDQCDVLVAMNPAALKRGYKILKPGGVIIVDIDSFNESGLKKAQFETEDPFKELGINAQVIEAPVTSMTKAALADSEMDVKSVLKCRNIFALGLVCWLFDRPLEGALKLLKNKFAKKPAVYEANWMRMWATGMPPNCARILNWWMVSIPNSTLKTTVRPMWHRCFSDRRSTISACRSCSTVLSR